MFGNFYIQLNSEAWNYFPIILSYLQPYFVVGEWEERVEASGLI